MDWQRRGVDVYRRAGDALALVAALRDGDVLTSPLLPGLEFLISSRWPPTPR